MVFAGVAIGLIWLLFVGAWLFLYAGGYSLLQNVGIFFLSLAVVAILETALWLPWGMKHPSGGKS